MQNVEVTVEKDENGKHISVAISEDLLVDASNYVTYDIYSNGEIVVSNQLVPHSNFAPGGNGEFALPKVGMRMQVAEGYENLEYYGRGPDENYCDRKTGSKWACTRAQSTNNSCISMSSRRRTATAQTCAGRPSQTTRAPA